MLIFCAWGAISILWHTAACLNIPRAAPAELKLCSVEYGRSEYNKGQWVERRSGLTVPFIQQVVDSVTHHVSDQIVGVNLTKDGERELEKMQSQYAHCKTHQRACLWSESGARDLASMNWAWRPTGCKLSPLSFESLPAWLLRRKARLLFYGDSLNDDMAKGLMCRLQQEDEHLIRSWRKDNLGSVESRSGFGLANGVHFVSQDLSALAWAGEDITSNDILVLNAGAHWWSPVEKAHRAFLSVAKQLWELPAKPKAVIFRTTVMGHHGCESHFYPIQDMAAQNEVAQQSSDMYNWANFTGLNAAIIEAFRLVWPPDKFFVLDVSMFENRADGHAVHAENGESDCLHYCMPGAPMVWNELLMHVVSPALKVQGPWPLGGGKSP